MARRRGARRDTRLSATIETIPWANIAAITLSSNQGRPSLLVIRGKDSTRTLNVAPYAPELAGVVASAQRHIAT